MLKKEKTKMCMCVMDLGKVFTKTYHMLQTSFEDECIRRSMYQERFKWFKEADRRPQTIFVQDTK